MSLRRRSAIVGRDLAMGLLIVAALAVPRPARTTAQAGVSTLGGRIVVLDGATASPIRRAHVTLTTPTGAVLSTDSDTDGRYRFDSLSAGRYQLDVVKAGFFVLANTQNGAAVAGTPVQIEAGATAVKDVAVERGSAIEGRVLDTNGEPVRDVAVLVRAGRRGEARVTSAAVTVLTNDRGQYRVYTLPPGEYLVQAGLRGLVSPAAAPVPDPRGILTYYPGVGNVQDAQPVTVVSGRVTTGIDFTLMGTTRRPGPVGQGGVAIAGGSGRITGRVTNGDGGRPLANIAVVVRPTSPPFNRQLTVVTNTQGQFEATGLPAGGYRVLTTADGFVPGGYGWTKNYIGGRPIELGDKGVFEGADIVMTRFGALEGRVMDEFGDPVSGTIVQLAEVFYGGVRMMAPVGSTMGALPRPTDDTGAFRIFDANPGDYYVIAASGAFVNQSALSGFALTFYPGTRTGADARLVRVAAGTDTAGTDFALVPVRLRDVRGVVVTDNGQAVPDAFVALLPMSGGDVRMRNVLGSGRSADDGTFVIAYVPEGAYAAQASVASFQTAPGGGNRQALFGYTTVEVDGPATTGLRVEVRPPATFRARVVFDGPEPHPATRDVSINLSPVDGISAPFEQLIRLSTYGENGSVETPQQIGRNMIRASVRQQDSWVMTRVTRDGVDVTDEVVDFGRGDVNGVEITFKQIGASLSGAVTDGNRPVPGHSVVVFAADSQKWAWVSRFITHTETDGQGRYRVTGLVPGEYLVVAVPPLTGFTWLDPDYLRKVAGQATPVTLLDKDVRTVALRLVR